MPTIVHFEIPADEVDRARTFYQRLFDWKFEQFPGMDYWYITTGEDSIGGGLLKRRDPHQPVTNYINVNSLDEYVKKMESLGGNLIVPRTTVPGMGYFAVCLDTEGNTFGLWETDSSAK